MAFEVEVIELNEADARPSHLELKVAILGLRPVEVAAPQPHLEVVSGSRRRRSARAAGDGHKFRAELPVSVFDRHALRIQILFGSQVWRASEHPDPGLERRCPRSVRPRADASVGGLRRMFSRSVAKPRQLLVGDWAHDWVSRARAGTFSMAAMPMACVRIASRFSRALRSFAQTSSAFALAKARAGWRVGCVCRMLAIRASRNSLSGQRAIHDALRVAPGAFQQFGKDTRPLFAEGSVRHYYVAYMNTETITPSTARKRNDNCGS